MFKIERIKNIELLRIIGCISIILYHLFLRLRAYDGGGGDLLERLCLMTQNGNKAVDLFFIISGFFFASTINLKQSIWDFVKKKILRFYPVLIFAFILCFFISLTGAFKFHYYDNVMCFLLLSGTPLVTKLGNIASFWYVSAMFWVMLAMLYSLKNFNKKTINFVLAIAIFFSYALIIHAKGGKIDSIAKTFCYVFNVGMLRAIGGIGIGYFIAEWYTNNIEAIKNYTYNIYQKLCLTVVEFMCLYFIINNLMLHKLKFQNDIIFIVAFTVIIICFLLKGGILSRFFEMDFWGKYSKYTYSIYVMHLVVFNAFKGLIWKPHTDFLYTYPVFNIVTPIVLALIAGVLTYHFVEKPCAVYFSKKNS